MYAVRTLLPTTNGSVLLSTGITGTLARTLLGELPGIVLGAEAGADLIQLDSWASLTISNPAGTQTITPDDFTGPILASNWNVTLDGRFIANVCDTDGRSSPRLQILSVGN